VSHTDCMVVVITGPIASGKSTIARELARELGRAQVRAAVLRRAQDDPTRGLSRDPGFLASYFAALSERIATPPATGLVIDTEQTTATSAAAEIARLVLPKLST
jgi:nicotinamide riboside kinase